MSDSGHADDRMSARWAAGNPAAVVDYGDRSIAATAVAARRLVAAFYGRPARYRYFVGCSNGGRQALMAAQRYPGDWDGVLAGSPANPWTEQLYRFAALQHPVRQSAAGLGGKLPLIERAALASCPPASVQNGVASDPRRCRFAPEALRCRGSAENCLTPAEAALTRAIVAAGYAPTSAAGAEGWGRWILGTTGDSQAAFAEQAYRYLLQDAPQWSVADFQPAAAKRAAARLSGVLDVAPEFRRFRARGGKILSYFGWGDALIAPRLALDFHADVVSAAGGAAAAASFYRLFMIPGMAHCQGGAGAVAFGQTDGAGGPGDADHDIRAALEAWVENGQPPNRLIAVSADGRQRIELAPEAGGRSSDH